MKVLITEPLSDKGIEIFNSEDNISVDIETKLSQEELIKCISDYEALIVRSGTKVTSEVIEAGKRLKVIGRAGVGVDNVDVYTATKQGVIVVNTPNANTISAAEHTMTLILALSRNIVPAGVSMKDGEWERQRFMGVEVYGKTLGIIGLGRIGTEVAKRAQAFGMHIIAADPYISPETVNKLNVELVDNQAIFRRSDYITVHLPMNEETCDLLDEDAFSMMKDGVRIVNCARGGICNEQALYNAIVSGKVAGAALDVFVQEPPADSPLLTLDSVLATPHLGASTKEALVNVSVEIAHQVVDALKGRPVHNAVNMITLDLGDAEKLRPYMHLAEKIGNIHGQLVEGHVIEVNIDYSGEIATCPTEIVSIAVQKGLFQTFLGDTVNYVNSAFICRERGIKLSETKSSEIEDFVNLITVTVKTDKTEKRVAGTIFGTREPRIIEIDGYHLDVMPSGYLLFLRTRHDRPGIMGALGNILGEYNINIAGMSLGRERPHSNAMAVLTLDNPVSKDVIERIKSLDAISEARVIRLD